MVAPQQNRFAIFAAPSDEKGSSEKARRSEGAPSGPAPPQPSSSSAVSDSDWQVVTRGGNANKTAKFDEKAKAVAHPRAPFTHLPVNQRAQLPLPSSQLADNTKPSDEFENWCGVCRIKFPSKPFLQNHAKGMPGHENYCNLCKRVFKDRNGLSNHVQNSYGHDIVCNICLSAFDSKNGLANHFENRQLTVGHKYVCWVCLEGFMTEADMERHMKKSAVHVFCKTCNRTFESQELRDAHWKSTAKHRHCLVSGCTFDAMDAAVLERHLQEAHFQCEGCREILPSVTRLNNHLQYCAQIVTCKGCALLTSRNKLAAHQPVCPGHSDAQNTAASDIGHMPILGGKFNSHPQAATSKTTTSDPINIPCFFCPERFHSSTHLIKHLETEKCANLRHGLLLIEILGKFWHSVLYMDVDLHRIIREGTVDMPWLVQVVKEGELHPYICRSPSCGEKTFARLSSLVYHVESGECEWTMQMLRMDLFAQEVVREYTKAKLVIKM